MARLRNGMPNQDFDQNPDDMGGGDFGGAGGATGFPPPTSPEDILKKQNQYPPTHEQRGGEGPRERPVPHRMPLPGGTAGPGPVGTPPMPHYPSPQAGSQAPGTGASTDQMGMGGMGGASTFSPMPSPGIGALTSARRSLYGKAGGLLGGGLGAQDTTSNNMSDPISSLIQLLQKKTPGGF